MKRKFVVVLTVIMALQMVFDVTVFCAASETNIVEKRPEGVLVETSNNISTDFTKNVPKEMKDNIKKIKGESVYSVDGKNTVLGDVSVGKSGSNAYAEVDFKLVKSTGSTSGAFSITPFSTGGQASLSVRFAYVSAVKYNPETKMGDGTDVIRDRIAIVTTSSYSINKWTYGAISDHELGVQTTSNETPWLRMKAMSVDGVYYLSAYDEVGNLLDSLSISAEELLGENIDSLAKTGSFQITTNSCEVLFDNLSCGDVELIKNPTFKFDTKTAKINAAVGCALISSDGKEVPSSNAQILVDEKEPVLDDNGQIVFKELGKHEAKARMFDIISGEYVEYSADIDIKEEIDFKNLEITSEKAKVYKNELVSIDVKGIDANKDYFKIYPEEYEILEPASHTQDAVSFGESGRKKIKVKNGTNTAETEVYVSQYEALIPYIEKNQIEQGQSVAYSLSKRDNSADSVMNSNEYSVKADHEGLVIEDGKILAEKTGEYILSFKADEMTEEVKISVIEKQQGTIIDENFESDAVNEYFMYPADHVVSDNGNKVLRLADEETAFFGGNGWKRYNINAKVKIVTPVIDERCEYATFEIKSQTKPAADQKKLGGTGGIPCIYRINHNIDSGPHMRISTVAGPDINIEDGEYHDFSIEVYRTQVIFTIDGVKQYNSVSTNDNGYFNFMANNCEVYIDDVVVTKDISAWGKEIASLTAKEDVVEVNPYEPWQFKAINAFSINYTDGTFAYITNFGTSYSYSEWDDNTIEYEQVDGFEYGDVLRKNTIVFNKDVQDGAKITVKAKYQGHECLFTVKAKCPAQDYAEYVKNRVDVHRENYAFRMVYGYNKGIDNSVDARATLPHRMSVMTIYPKIRDYSSMFEWYAKSAEYEDKYVGRGSDAGDFIILQGMATYIRLKGIANVSDEAWNGWKDYMLSYKWVYPYDTMSENHKMIYFATAILAGETWPNDTMYNGLSGTQTAEEQTKYLIDWFNHRIALGIQEYDSPMYYSVDLFAGELFYSSVKSEKLKRLSYDFLTMLYADTLPDALEDNSTGAHLRAYHYVEYTSKIKSLAFSFNVSTYMTDEFYQMNVQEGQYAFTEYMPPDAIFEIALDNDKYIENKERHSVYTLMDDKAVTESIRKYTYTTPEYSVGCNVFIDDLSKYRDANYNLYAQNEEYDKLIPIYAAYQDIEWSINLGKGNSAIITENHPGSAGGHDDFNGDSQCLCGMYYQNLGASIGMHKIVKESEKQYTHFWVPKSKLQHIEENNGWIFINHFGVFVAIKPLKDGKRDGVLYEWGDEAVQYSGLARSECEVIVNSKDSAFVSEVTSEKDFGDTFEKFKAKILSNEKNISYSVSGGEYYIEYTALDGSKLKIDYNNNKRYLNDIEIDFEDYKTFDNKYVSAEWRGDTINISGTQSSYDIGTYKADLNFAEAARLINTINEMIGKFEYEKKFGRGISTIAANTEELENCINVISQYGESYLYNILQSRLNQLIDLVNEIYNSGGTREQNGIEEIREKLNGLYHTI